MKHLEKGHVNDKKLNVITVENALCIPDQGKLPGCFNGGVFDNQKNPVEISFQRDSISTATRLLDKTDVENAEYYNESVVYLGQYRVHYGSFLVDSISTLWYTLEHPEKYSYIYLSTQSELGECLHSSTIDFFSFFGIDKSQIRIITKPSIFKEVIIPEESYKPLKEYHPDFLKIIKRVTTNALNSIPLSNAEVADKVYFSRSKFSNKLKSDFGEEYIVELFKVNGFKIIYPEEHTLAEQIFYVNNCKVFASIGGSCAHNILFSFSKPQMILLNRMNGYQFHQWFLNEMADVEPIIYVDTYCEPFKKVFETNVTGPFLYWYNRNLLMFAKDNSFIIPKVEWYRKVHCFVRYSFYCLKAQVHRIKSKNKRFLRYTNE